MIVVDSSVWIDFIRGDQGPECEALGELFENGIPAIALVTGPVSLLAETRHAGVDLDLSDVLFICTANDVSAISGPLRDRLEILELEVKDQHLDGDLVRIFIEAKVWQPVIGAGAGQRRT